MYNKFSQDYDRFVNWHNRLAFELPFLLTQLGSVTPQPGAPLRVLDAACGTGQHVIALAKKGLDVTGADLSSEMIAVARANASAAGLDLRFEAGWVWQPRRNIWKRVFRRPPLPGEFPPAPAHSRRPR